jgi:hypothetical protein
LMEMSFIPDQIREDGAGIRGTRARQRFRADP